MTSKRTKELRRKAKGGTIATKEEFRDYPELFNFFYDSGRDCTERTLGISPLNEATYNKIRSRYENGEYPEHLRRFAENELALKLRGK
jgi:hypothetical protein